VATTGDDVCTAEGATTVVWEDWMVVDIFFACPGGVADDPFPLPFPLLSLPLLARPKRNSQVITAALITRFIVIQTKESAVE
jgi:hypothetical protein